MEDLKCILGGSSFMLWGIHFINSGDWVWDEEWHLARDSGPHTWCPPFPQTQNATYSPGLLSGFLSPLACNRSTATAVLFKAKHGIQVSLSCQLNASLISFIVCSLFYSDGIIRDNTNFRWEFFSFKLWIPICYWVMKILRASLSVICVCLDHGIKSLAFCYS